jgi:hypothetical protein
MGRAILALYRSAAQPVMADLGRGLEGRGHWWMLEDPAHGAEVLERFLSAP